MNLETEQQGSDRARLQEYEKYELQRLGLWILDIEIYFELPIFVQRFSDASMLSV